MIQSLEELSDAAANALAELTRRRTFEEARAALKEAGMHAARAALAAALERIEQRQQLAREQQAVVQQTGERLEQAIAAAEWDLDARFVQEGNKTFLVDGDERRPMTADARRDWKKLEAVKQPAVAAAQSAHRQAQFDLDACKDAVAQADRAFSAARADLSASIASVGLFAAAISTKKEEAA